MKSVIMSLIYLNLFTYLFSLLAVMSVSYSTRRSVESLARLAFEHGARVNELANCRDPKPQLIYFNDPAKVFIYTQL